MLAKLILEVKQRADPLFEDKTYKMENVKHEGAVIALCKSDIIEEDLFQVMILRSI